MLIRADVTTVKILPFIEKTVKKLLSVSCVDKRCCDDCEDTTIHRENCEEELRVSCVKICCDDCEDTAIHRETCEKRTPECKLCW